MKSKVILGIMLFAFGLMGIASMLTMEMSLPSEVEAMLGNQFSSREVRLLSLINPTIMLLIAVIVGTVLYQKVHLKTPLIEKITGINNDNFVGFDILKYGILGGILSGVLLVLVGLVFNPIVPTEFLKLGESFKPALATRFLYGGITEEIIMRFGLMTLIVWIASKLLNGTKPIIYWAGIIIAAIVFALAHFPIVYQLVGDPSFLLLTYILIGNSIGGIIFGWLYWKKGFESAVMAHIFAHVVIVLAELMPY